MDPFQTNFHDFTSACEWLVAVLGGSTLSKVDRFVIDFLPVSYTHLTLPTIYSV